MSAQKAFLDYYKDNLHFLRVLSNEFALQFPKIAARLEINEVNCKDPFVERLLEGAAFLCARIEKRLDEGHPRLLESILNQCAPFALLPCVSTAVGLIRNTELAALKGHSLTVGAGSRWRGSTFESATKFTLSVLFDTKAVPLEIGAIDYENRVNANFKAVGSSVLSFDLQTQGRRHLSEVDADNLDVYLNLSDTDASACAELMIEHLNCAVLEYPDGTLVKQKLSCNYSIFESSHLLLEDLVKTNIDLSYLYLYLAYPKFFKFVRIKGLKNLAAGSKVKVHLIFDAAKEALLGKMGAQCMIANALPLINLFSQRISRTPWAWDYEYHLTADRTAPLDFEILKVKSLELIDSYNRTQLTLQPFFTARTAGSGVCTDFFDEHKRKRELNSERSLKSSYQKNETYVTLSGPAVTQLKGASMSIAGMVWCSNADLLLFMRPGTALESADLPSLGNLTLLERPSAPSGSLASQGRADDYRKLSYIALNLTSFLQEDGDLGIMLLQNLILNYSVRELEENRRLSGSILGFESSETTFRLIKQGCVYFERGFAVKITVSESALAGVGHYTFLRMLCAVLSGSAPVNLPLRLEFYSEQSGKIFTWISLKNS